MSTVIPKISQLSNKIIRVLGCNPGPMTLQGTNTYIIGTGNRRLLLDTGEAKNEEYITNLTSVLKDKNINLDKIVITHWHHDHIGGIEEVLKLADDEVTVMKFPRKNPPDDHLSMKKGQLKWLSGNDLINVEGASLRVVFTPGHTTDHIVLELEEDKAIFAGDCILGEGTSVFEDLYDYMQSLKIILDRQPTVIYPGHGPVIEDPKQRLEYYIAHRNQRERQILDALKEEPLRHFTAMDLVKIIYKETPEHLHSAASYNVGHHLVKLEKEKLAQCVDKSNNLYRFQRIDVKL